MRTYLTLMRLPGVFALTASQLLARLPVGMISIAILIHVQHTSGSYALAGVGVACTSIGQAVAMPLTSRLAGTAGIARTLLGAAVLNAAALLGLALSAPQLPVLLVLGGLVGATMPPLLPVARALYPQLVPGDAVTALFALDTTAQELLWIVGPVATTLLASAVSTALPLIVAALATVSGTTLFLMSLRRRSARISPARTAFGRVLTNRSVIVALVASLALVASYMALEVGIVACLGHSPITAGAILAASGVGSLIGGVTLGHRRLRTRELAAVIGVVVVGTALTAVAPGPWWQAVAVLAAGFGFAPALSTLYARVSEDLEEHATSEAFGWLNTGILVGAAVGTALAGALNDGFGRTGVFTVATALAAIAATPLMSSARRQDHEDADARCSTR